jgi:hypothetical protein
VESQLNGTDSCPTLATSQLKLTKSPTGVICNTGDGGNFDYICGAEVTEFRPRPTEFARIRIPPQTYAVGSSTSFGRVSGVPFQTEHFSPESQSLFIGSCFAALAQLKHFFA